MLYSTSSQQAFTTYGAIWYSHFQDSLSNGTSFNKDVMAQCSITNQQINYTTGCTRFNGVGYTIQYNFTAIHASLLFEQIANEALVRRGVNNTDIIIETIIAPLPVTSAEEKIGAGIDGFLAWFLVSTLLKAVHLIVFIFFSYQLTTVNIYRLWLVSHLLVEPSGHLLSTKRARKQSIYKPLLVLNHWPTGYRRTCGIL